MYVMFFTNSTQTDGATLNGRLLKDLLVIAVVINANLIKP